MARRHLRPHRWDASVMAALQSCGRTFAASGRPTDSLPGYPNGQPSAGVPLVAARTTAATTPAATPAEATATTTAIFTRAGFIDGQRAAFVLLAI